MDVRVPKYSVSLAEKLNTEKAVRHFVKSTLQDRTQLLWIVAGGWGHWMKMARESFQGFLVDDELLCEMWNLFEKEAGPEPGKQLDMLMKGNAVGMKLEKLAKIAAFFENERDLDTWLIEKKAIADPHQRMALRSELMRLIKARQQYDSKAIH